MDLTGQDTPTTGSKGPVFVTKLIGGKAFSATFSFEEASEKGFFSGAGYSLIDAGEDLPRRACRFTVECPRCGLTKEDFDRTGRFGCGECYQVFRPFLSGLLDRIHPGKEHVGKTPRSNVDRAVVEARLVRLGSELEQAVSREDFEAAARLRDEISGWKTKIA